jgi:hypothetical protein
MLCVKQITDVAETVLEKEKSRIDARTDSKLMTLGRHWQLLSIIAEVYLPRWTRL